MNALDTMIDSMRQQGDLIAGGMIPLGHNLVGHLAIIALVLGIAWPLIDRLDIALIVSTLIGIIAVAFFALWLIDETPTITRAIDASLMQAASSATGFKQGITPGQVLQQGDMLVADLNSAAAAASTASGWDLYTSIINALITLALEVGFLLVAWNFALYEILAYVIVPLTAPLIALIVLPLTRGFAMGVFRFWIAIAVGLMAAVIFAGLEANFAHLWISQMDAACQASFQWVNGAPLTPMAGPHFIKVCNSAVSTTTAMGYMGAAILYGFLAVGCTALVAHAVGVWAGNGLEHASMAIFASNQVSRMASSVTGGGGARGGAMAASAATRNAAAAQVREAIQNSIP
jgi:hypothetical protein